LKEWIISKDIQLDVKIFTLKNKEFIKDFTDVRTIAIIPAQFKLFVGLIYDYMEDKIHRFIEFHKIKQFGFLKILHFLKNLEVY